MPTTIVRYATPNDAPALLELYRQLSDRSPLPTLDETVAVIDEMATHPGLHLLVAEIEGEVAGTATIAVIPSITHLAKPWAQIENVVVLDAYRRRGVGKALMDRCADITRAAGGYKMQLISSDVRREAHAFYLAAGFEDEFRGFRMYF